MDAAVLLYVVYGVTVVSLTVWVGRTLARNGEVFLIDVFAGDTALASAVNRLLIVGFFLVNLGYAALILRLDTPVVDLRGGIEALSVKVGGVLVVLGVVHLCNVLVLQRVRRRRMFEARSHAPVSQTAWAPQPQPAPTGAWQPSASPAGTEGGDAR